MKKIETLLIFTFFFFFCSISTVSASEEEKNLVSVINNGEITKKYLEMMQATSVVHIKAEQEKEGVISVYLSVLPLEEGKEKTDTVFSLLYDAESNQYVMSYIMQETEEDENVLSFMKIMPYYGVEMSERFSEFQSLLHEKELLPFMNEVFDKCYMEEMGICFTNVTQYKAMLYLVKIEKSEKAIQYAINYAKEINREEKEKKHTANLMLVAFILLVLIGVVLLLRKCFKV